ncbi:hypothetical protein QVD17_25376 [Tagetes erecta]|uniref:Uncharacterized protein n=1 Tax=Tagetes erecta TaxID=13708 RepID=A0AAD8KMK8_TARER|nr:hypothetical protein QVD17_25376 [Tagetes erecta]
MNELYIVCYVHLFILYYHQVQVSTTKLLEIAKAVDCVPTETGTKRTIMSYSTLILLCVRVSMLLKCVLLSLMMRTCV